MCQAGKGRDCWLVTPTSKEWRAWLASCSCQSSHKSQQGKIRGNKSKGRKAFRESFHYVEPRVPNLTSQTNNKTIKYRVCNNKTIKYRVCEQRGDLIAFS